MNKNGQIFILRFMTATFILLLALGFLNPFKDTIILNRDSSHLDCTNTSISDGSKITCLGLDMSLWYFLGAIIVAGIGVLWERKQSSG